ncbi:MAG: amino acid permease [Methyloprofundus sp.]|nr:amino acid permease [Methyloprofundus sp.]
MDKKPTLKRVITLPLLVFYGAGTILGAGIYALIGKITALSGVYAPFSFLISACIAAFVAFTYAELSSRYPKSAGEAIYVNQAFSKTWLAALVGWGIVLTGIVSSAVMARAFSGYLQEFIAIPSLLAIILFVFVISSVAIIGISLSIHLVTLITLIEISGIILVLYVCREQLLAIPDSWQILIPPFSWSIWKNIIFGAFIAFYAFIGFEDMVNVAEEVVEPEKNLPLAIILALLVSTVFYILVSLAAVLSIPIQDLANHKAPFVLIIQENSNIPVAIISLISLIAILNGALVQVVMGSRVLFGMAEKGMAPKPFGIIYAKTRTPVIATLFFAVILIVMALWFPIMVLAKITSFIILLIFALISLSLCIIKIKNNSHTQQRHLNIPVVIPALSFVFCLGFILLQFL